MTTKLKAVKRLSAKTHVPKTKPVTPPEITLPPLSEDYDILELERPLDLQDAQELNDLDPSNELNEMETRLVSIYLDHPDQPKQVIANLAGYKAKSPKTLITIFNRVIAKWERGVHRLDTFRSAGLGELRVALRMRQLMMQDKNLGVAKDMAVHVSKIMDLVNPALDLADGFEIRVKRAEKQAEPQRTGPERSRIRVVEKKAQVKD
jgi:hypothetical protein